MSLWLKASKTDDQIEDEVEALIAERVVAELEPFDGQGDLEEIDGELYYWEGVQKIRKEVQKELATKYPDSYLNKLV